MQDMSCTLLKVLGTNVEVIFKDREAFDNLTADKGIVFVANHQSNFDIPVILTGIAYGFRFCCKTRNGIMAVFLQVDEERKLYFS